MNILKKTTVSYPTILLLAVLFTFISSRPVFSQRSFPPDSSIKIMLQDLVADPQSNGIAVGILEPDGKRRVITYGSTGSGGHSLDKESVFEIGSITKVFTGVLLADMVRRGEVELSEPIENLLPLGTKIPTYKGKKITLLDLATHTSGLPVMPGNFPQPQNEEAYSIYTMEDVYDFLSSYELQYEPGLQYQYSNFLTLLGHGLSLRAGMPYEVLLRERILEPLEMEKSSVTLTTDMQQSLTRGHTRFGEPSPYFIAPVFMASGGLKSTVGDMLDFAAANLSHKKTGIYASLYNARRPLRQIGNSGDYAGLGWGTDSLGQEVGHSGGTFGYNSYININLKEHRAIIVMANSSGRIANTLGVHLLKPDKYPMPKPSIAREIVAVYKKSGLNAAIKRYRELHASAPTRWNFSESELNKVGYWMLGQGSTDDAIAIFKLNVNNHPDSPNMYDSLGDAYMAAGQYDKAVDSYKKAVELANKSGHSNLSYFKKNLERAREKLNN